MLFSASMTDEVDELIRLSLNHPVRLFVDKSTDLASNLVQEFIRIRKHHEEDRDAVLISLCKRTFKSQCIIFFTAKKSVHRMKIIFGLMGLKAAELHGSLTQLNVWLRTFFTCLFYFSDNPFFSLLSFSVLNHWRSSEMERWTSCCAPTWLRVVWILLVSPLSSM